MTPAQDFFNERYEFFKDTSFVEHLQTTASEKGSIKSKSSVYQTS